MTALVQVALDRIDIVGDNVRHDVGDISELASSIAEVGVLVPVLVEPVGDRYRLIGGHRRVTACRSIGLESVPAMVHENGDRLLLMLTENLHRVELTPTEKGLAFKRLAERGLTQEQVGEKCGVTQTTVSNYLKLLELPVDVRTAVDEGKLSLHYALSTRRKKYRSRAIRVTEPDPIDGPAPEQPAFIDTSVLEVKALRPSINELADACERTGYDFDRAKSYAVRLTKGLSTEEALAIVTRLVQSRPAKAVAS